MRHEITSKEAAAIHKARAAKPITSSLDPRYAASEQRELDQYQSQMELRYKTQ